MAKFDFQSSRYAKFFSSDSNINYLQRFVDETGIFYTNYGWYLTQGHKDTMPTNAQSDGTLVFNISARKLVAAPLMSLRAPLGDAPQGDKDGLSFYSATIPEFIADGFVETALERYNREKMYEAFGNDAEIVAAWADTVQDKINSVDATLTYMTAQLLSTGKIDYSGIGKGIQAPLHKANIPDENFVGAGDYVWTDSENCKVLSQMRTIENAYRDKFSYSGQLVWQVPRDMFYNTILTNPEVLELVASYKKNPLNWVAQVDGQSVMEAEFRNAVRDFFGLSTIEIVTEKERNATYTTDGFVNGWDQTKVVLRPAGDAVVFKWGQNVDRLLHERYQASSISKVWATTNNGLGTLVNTTLDNGQFKEFHTDMMLTACPALLNFPYHYIIDTATAG